MTVKGTDPFYDLGRMLAVKMLALSSPRSLDDPQNLSRTVSCGNAQDLCVLS